MPTVFLDHSGNSRHLTITTPADWTIHSADLPNGDNSASLSTTLNQNAVWDGEQYCIPTGSGTEGITVEVWINVTAGAANRYIAQVRADSTGVGGTDRHWQVWLDSSEQITFTWFNTIANAFIQSNHALAAGWHHCVGGFSGGSSKFIRSWIDGVLIGTNTTTAGTMTTASSGTYKLFVGSNRINTTEEMTDHGAKLAIYNGILTDGQVADHYAAMAP